MVKSKEEILEMVKGFVGENTDDNTISFIEDITDTLTDLETKKETDDSEDWKSKFEENDATWRKKYTERFFNTEDVKKDNENKEEKEDKESPKNFEDLFTEED